jgi:hypothetical protein
MATIGGRNNFGLFKNGDFRNATVADFTFGVLNTTDQYKGSACIQMTGGNGSNGFSQEYIEIDPTQKYQQICYVRTLQRGSQTNSLAGGHIGFACYDDEKRYIEQAHLGGRGNTVLTRDANPGDSYIYIADKTGWYQTANTSWFFRYINFYPATHPKYSTPYQYTRIGRDQVIIYTSSIEQMPEGDYRLQLQNTSGNPTTLPNVGYSLPAGTPVSNGMAGAGFNYILGNPDYPETWTRFASGYITGLGNDGLSGYSVFRWGTKYIRFLILLNYNRSGQTQDHVWALDNIFFGQITDNKDYRKSL